MNRPRPKYQVFISSTFEDLREERKDVTWTVLKQGQIPVGMEAFPANDDRGWTTITRLIDDTDYYVVILAGRYGSIDPETGLSWTHREYRYARDQGVPVFAFLRKASRLVDTALDKGKSRRMLEEFKQELREKHLVKEWETALDLCGLVGEALSNRILDDEHRAEPRPGWFRGSPGAFEAIEEFARLSSENARLRAAVEAAREAPKPQLRLIWPGGAPVEEELPGPVCGDGPVDIVWA